MEIRRLDATPYLAEGEIVQYKTSAKQSRFKVVQLVLCWLIALVAVAGDCFLLSMTYALNEQLTNVNTFLMPPNVPDFSERQDSFLICNPSPRKQERAGPKEEMSQAVATRQEG